MSEMARRAFVALLSGVAMRPFVVLAQSDRTRRVGVIMGFAENDEVWQAFLATFRLALQDLGWKESGGLISYGINQMEQALPAASYVNQILRGANPGDLPVQLPLKYELVINLKTAASLGLPVPNSLQLLADHIIE
jgi:ABC transporter substrate binding protein